MAILSWAFIETPFRKGFAGIGPGRLARNAFIAALAVVGVSYAVMYFEGVPERFSARVRRIETPPGIPQKFSVELSDLNRGEVPTLGKELLLHEHPDFIVWGDSHSMALARCFDAYALDDNLSGVIAARRATVPILEVWRPNFKDEGAVAPKWNEAVFKLIRKKEIKHVVLVSRWAVNIEGRPNGKMDSLISIGDKPTSKQVAKESLEIGLNKTLDELEALGAHVWILKQVPLQHADPHRSIVRNVAFGWELPKGVSLEEHHERQKNVNEVFERVLSGRDNVTVIDLSDPFFDGSKYSQVGNETGSFYRDDDHLSDLGASTLIRPILESKLKLGETPSDQDARAGELE